jgi:hypothetical protein
MIGRPRAKSLDCVTKSPYNPALATAALKAGPFNEQMDPQTAPRFVCEKIVNKATRINVTVLEATTAIKKSHSTVAQSKVTIASNNRAGSAMYPRNWPMPTQLVGLMIRNRPIT